MFASSEFVEKKSFLLHLHKKAHWNIILKTRWQVMELWHRVPIHAVDSAVSHEKKECECFSWDGFVILIRQSQLTHWVQIERPCISAWLLLTCCPCTWWLNIACLLIAGGWSHRKHLWESYFRVLPPSSGDVWFEPLVFFILWQYIRPPSCWLRLVCVKCNLSFLNLLLGAKYI